MKENAIDEAGLLSASINILMLYRVYFTKVDEIFIRLYPYSAINKFVRRYSEILKILAPILSLRALVYNLSDQAGRYRKILL